MMDNYVFYGCHMCGDMIKECRTDAYQSTLECKCGCCMKPLISVGEVERENIRTLNREMALGDRPV